METITQTLFKCSICKHAYSTEKEALDCESKPVEHDRGVKVGDKVRITNGEGVHEQATVTDVYVVDRHWGHYAWKKYWHTVAVNAKLDNSWGSRMLTFDSYERVG
jgi:hypothetical protein